MMNFGFELFDKVKRKINVTWEDNDTNARIEDIMESAIVDLKHLLGISDPNFDFNKSGAEQTLFLAHCFYEWNHALDEFAENYAGKIMQVRQMWEVKQYREDQSEEEV